MRAVLFVAAICLTVFTQAAAADLDWRAFRNHRFGLTLRYPADIFAQHRSSDFGDGDFFATPDGSAKLLVGALENVEGHSPASYQRFIAQTSYPGLRVDYA